MNAVCLLLMQANTVTNITAKESLKKKQSLNDWEVASVLMFPVNY